MRRWAIAILVARLLSAGGAGAAAGIPPVALDTLREDTLRAVTVSVTRMPPGTAHPSAAVTVLRGVWLRRAEPQLTLRESLAAVPGVWLSGEANFAQDVRIAIRGFGARAAFGIRGIRLLLDGVPETAPDGQGQVDNIDLAVVDRVEVLRSSAGSLYGNAAGGVLSLHSEGIGLRPSGRVRLAMGSWGYRQVHLSGGGRIGRHGLRAAFTRQQLAGYREHSAMRTSLLNARWEWLSRDSSLSLRTLVNYTYSPQADDAGALTAQEVALNRRAVAAAQRRFDAGESVRQGRVGIFAEHKGPRGALSTARVYGVRRSFENRLPFRSGGQVALERYAGGIGIQHVRTTPRQTLSVGLDADYQRDRRRRFQNLDGQRGALAFDQWETFTATGLFLSFQYRLGKGWQISTGARADAVWLRADDKFDADGDQSGRAVYPRFNPQLGLIKYLGNGWSTHLSWATHFETPTLSELSSHPAGKGGFNPDLQPQYTHTWEIGVEGRVGSPLYVHGALFWALTRDEITPYEQAETPGRLYYRNAGRTQRAGAELRVIAQPSPGWSVEGVWTSAVFRYERYSPPAGNFAGNRLPGLPQHWGMLDVRYGGTEGWFARAQLRYSGHYFADDANQVVVHPVVLLQGRSGFRWLWGGHAVEFFAGVDNAADTPYFHQVRLNAAGGRFFEPGAGRTFWVGLEWSRAAP